jgi:hypothetical protein
MARAALVCGSCFLQRWRFPDLERSSKNGTEVGGADTAERTGSSKAEVIFTNGYSIVRYANGAPDLGLMEGTWDGAETKDYRWSLGPIRPKLDKSEKKTWRLVETVVDETKGSFTQIYIFKQEEGEDAMDEVIELVWDTR